MESSTEDRARFDVKVDCLREQMTKLAEEVVREAIVSYGVMGIEDAERTVDHCISEVTTLRAGVKGSNCPIFF